MRDKYLQCKKGLIIIRRSVSVTAFAAISGSNDLGRTKRARNSHVECAGSCTLCNRLVVAWECKIKVCCLL